jgi:hypothetical protein
MQLPKFPKFFYLMWALSLTFGLAASAALVYIVLHFVLKFW